MKNAVVTTPVSTTQNLLSVGAASANAATITASAIHCQVNVLEEPMLLTHPVAKPAHRDDDLRLGRIGLDLLTQALHIHIECIIGNIFTSAIPNSITQHLTRNELALMLKEEEQQPIFEGIQEKFLARLGYAARRRIDSE